MSEELKFDLPGFTVFCVEVYRLSKGLSGSDVVSLFEEKDVFRFLKNNGDVLHCEGEESLVDLIDTFIATAG